MMVRIGDFLFHYRNGLFPVAYALLLVNSAPLLPNYLLAFAFGMAIALGGQLLRAITVGHDYIIRGGRDRKVYAERLVQGGLFAHCRNPLYVGNFLILFGIGVAANSLFFIVTAVPFFFFSYWAIISAEENFLRHKFGQEFDDYCARVNRIVPKFSGIGRTLAAGRFNWARLVNKEYGSAYIWFVGILFVTLKNLWVAGQWHTHPACIVWLIISIAVATIAYLVARFLKKTERLKD
jgi:protein-S-isoprenylcysteine O-methyltransferase Ste14